MWIDVPVMPTVSLLVPHPTPPSFEAKFFIAKGLRGAGFCKFLILKSRFS